MSIHQIYTGEESLKNFTYLIDNVEDAQQTYEQLSSQHILLVIMNKVNDLSDADNLIKRANDRCADLGGKFQRRVLWINSAEIQKALQPVLEGKLRTFSPEKKLEDYLAFSVNPQTGNIVYPIEKLSNIRIDLAFSKAELEVDKANLS